MNDYRTSTSRVFESNIAGVSFHNSVEDARTFIGYAEREPNNPYDENAIVIKENSGRIVGYIPGYMQSEYFEFNKNRIKLPLSGYVYTFTDENGKVKVAGKVSIIMVSGCKDKEALKDVFADIRNNMKEDFEERNNSSFKFEPFEFKVPEPEVEESVKEPVYQNADAPHKHLGALTVFAAVFLFMLYMGFTNGSSSSENYAYCDQDSIVEVVDSVPEEEIAAVEMTQLAHNKQEDIFIKNKKQTKQYESSTESYYSDGQCHATTKKGTRCKRSVSGGEIYCWQHR